MTQYTNQNISQRKKKNGLLKIQKEQIINKIYKRDHVGSSDFLIQSHEEVINKEAKQAEEEVRDPKQKKKSGNILSRINSNQSRSSALVDRRSSQTSR